VRAAGLRRNRPLSRSPARGWTRAVRICLVFSLLASLNYGRPRNTGTRQLLPRIPWPSTPPPRARGLLPRASRRENQASPARLTAPVPALTAATAPHLATTTIAPSARVPAARSTPRWAFYRRKRRRHLMRHRIPQLPRRPRFSVRTHGSQFLPGSPARLLSWSD
jgi:hypothetical protein